MKSILLSIILAVSLLSGCSLIPQKYDNNEYELLARLETSVVLINRECGDPEHIKTMIPELEYNALLLHTYTFYTPQNSEVYGIADILKKDVIEFKKQYDQNKATKTYCTIKSELFLKKVRTALEAVANKQR